ncbi:hypothetical protein M441DRAFT_65640 [Trichoderma asperellum CBS 433.97]|uniref:Uncharacterized protein n=1 Tax=Trichoderma asperellum (strain ATCC 204424 / CBS 433.97 / NBRC 101777) TaxID=1042311 RepID=A0A2T3ZGB5_TRIA4|nr:hypothetical protein M441DRAFT_65640 [Trichoderma asperellum CBS 433.97]PTB43852.1 hypothetical protein M441DRAFT_65640 [Trichoderma asperellum CBS 433.97]
MATEYTINARSAVAAVAASSKSFRVYFQDTKDGIREGVRLYSISAHGLLEEWCYSNGGQWAPGYLTKQKIQTAQNSSVAAVNWDGPNIRVYCQEKGSNAIQEYCTGAPHIRVYYQTPDLLVQEHCYDNGWSKGGFNPGAALKNTAIAATSWNNSGVHLHVYSQDSYGLLRGYKWSGSWEKTGFGSSVPVGTHMVAVNWDDGKMV